MIYIFLWSCLNMSKGKVLISSSETFNNKSVIAEEQIYSEIEEIAWTSLLGEEEPLDNSELWFSFLVERESPSSSEINNKEAKHIDRLEKFKEAMQGIVASKEGERQKRFKKLDA